MFRKNTWIVLVPGLTPEMFLSFGENLLWQYKEPSPEQFLGRLGRIGSEGTRSLSNAFPDCFKEGNIICPMLFYILNVIRIHEIFGFSVH